MSDQISLSWSKTYVEHNCSGHFYAITTDRSRNNYIVYISQNITNNINVIKLDAGGNIIFHNNNPTFTTDITTLKPVIKLDKCGNIYVMYISYNSSHKKIIVLIKHNALGHHMWIKWCGLLDSEGDVIPLISMDIDDNPLIYYTTQCLSTTNVIKHHITDTKILDTVSVLLDGSLGTNNSIKICVCLLYM